MFGRSATIALITVFSLWVPLVPAWAEGESRPASDAEKAFYQRVFKALEAAVPARGPQGWTVVEKTDFERLETVGSGTENEPFWVTYTVVWQNPAQIPADGAPAADEAGDSCREGRDARAEITVMANVTVESFMAPFAETEAVAGHPVYRTEGDLDPDFGWQEGVSFVFLGPGWQLSGEGDEAFMEALPRADLPHTRVQTVLVRVQAEEERARELLAAIDWKLLERLIGT
jgi:hypothetical protein